MTLGYIQRFMRLVGGLFPGGGGVKRPGYGVSHPPPFSAEVKESVELYFCSILGLLWANFALFNLIATQSSNELGL